MNSRECKVCYSMFIQFNSLQNVCSSKCARELKRTRNEAKKERNEINQEFSPREQNKSLQELIGLAQIVFNKYIRERDKGRECISCLRPYRKDFQAGHFHNANNHWSIRFDEKNVHGQCRKCNETLSGNESEYRANITKRISEKDLEELDRVRNFNANFSRDELNEIISEYKRKMKLLEIAD